MLKGVHLLLSYTCLFRCDHCFLHCGPDSTGTFTFELMDQLLEQARDTGTVKHICFEGGEPFLFYPLMLKGIQSANQLGFSVDIVTNGYWSQDTDDATRWLKPLVDAGLAGLNVSDDKYHFGDMSPSPAQAALDAATSLGIKATRFTIDPPCVREPDPNDAKGLPIVGGDVRFRGRAADELVKGLPERPWQEFTSCPDEDLEAPFRIHADSLGNVHLCQGVVIGNFREKPLAAIMDEYDTDLHPICGPLLRGGPAQLAQELGFKPEEGYVDACHLCYRVREHFCRTMPGCLSPPQVFGIQE